ncbi:ATP-dependent endonuclease [Candidatus Neomarinimicrobiota bacterium]
MKIKSVRIQNFRSILDETIYFDNYTCLVGPNGSGKSNVLRALNVFFREKEPGLQEPSKLTEDDFYLKDTSKPITITVTFIELNSEAQNDFSHYYRQDALVVSSIATYDPNSGIAEVEQHGERLGIKGFIEFFEADKRGDLVRDLKEIYNRVKNTYTDLPDPGTKPQMIISLHDYEANHPDKLELIQSRDDFYGVSKGTNLLEKYIQWVFVPAVKDATTENEESKYTAIGKLLDRTIRSKISFDKQLSEIKATAEENYRQIIESQQSALSEISKSLNKRISIWAHADAHLRLEWWQNPQKAIRIEEPIAHSIIGEGQFEGDVHRFGHGLQRSYLLAILQELASTTDQPDTTLILACEEPELYQHPPQARYMSQILTELSRSNSQIMLTSHSPYFVDGRNFNNVRMVRQSGMKTTVCMTSADQVAQKISKANDDANVPSETGMLAKIHQTMLSSINELFFTNHLILVEGLEDQAYIVAYLHLLNQFNEFHKQGCHIVPANAKNRIIRPLAIAQLLDIPTFVIFDTDGHKSDSNGSRKKHESDNITIFRLLGVENPDPFPQDHQWNDKFVAWSSDIGKVVQEEIGSDWNVLQEQANAHYGHIGSLQKNMLHISWCLSNAWDKGLKSPSLIRVCESIIHFGSSQD